MLPIKEPQFDFQWEKQGVPGINTLSNANCLIILREKIVSGEDPFKQYFQLSEVPPYTKPVQTDDGEESTTVNNVYNEENYKMISDIFSQAINSLWVMKLDPEALDALDDEKFVLIENENIDYGVFPDSTEGEIAKIISGVNSLREALHPIKWIFKAEDGSNLDKPYFIQFDADGMYTDKGIEISKKSILPVVMAQRAACPFTQSLTYKPVYKIAKAKRKTNIEETLSNGIMTLMKVNKKWVFARDINTLQTLGDKYDESFRQNQRIAVMDSIVKDIKNSWQTYWVGNYQNNAKNKNAFSAACNVYISGRGRDQLDPVNNGFFEIDVEEHKNILRTSGKTEEEIRTLNLAQLEGVDTGTNVYIKGKVKINGIMEDIQFKITASVE